MDVEAAIGQLEQLVTEARPVPLSASIIINKADIDEAVAQLRAALPEEIRQSRWVLKKQDELLAQATREADQILAEARDKCRRIVSETEIALQARKEADRIVTEARLEARGLRMEAEDYIDSKLAGFEIVLEKTMRIVARGRETLRGRLASEELSLQLAATERELILQAGNLPDSRVPAQFYDHETVQ
ncbi:MAG: ATPase [Egibacteraceae bacterium]